MQKFKERLSMIDLTEQQKSKIIKNAVNPPTKTSKLPYVVAPAFVLLAILFILMTNFGGTAPYTPSETTSASFIVLIEYELTNKTKIVIFINTLLILSNLYLFKRNLNVMKRWERSTFLQELHVYMRKPLVLVVLVLISGAILWGISISISYAQLFNETLLFWLVFGVTTQASLYHTKDNDWSCCPHCQVKFSRWQMHKKSFLEPRETCNACEQVIRVDKESNGDKIRSYTFIASLALGLNTLLELPLALTILSAFGMIIVMNYLYLPYAFMFKKEE